MEREKVIKGLECCLAVTKCGACPYNIENDLWCGNNDQLLEDALALLKAQEPRVMTWQEFITAPRDLENSVPLVMEQELPNRQTNDGWLIEWVGSNEYMYHYIAEMHPHLYNHRYYPKGIEFDRCGFRAWTAMPTKEQREATPWEA